MNRTEREYLVVRIEKLKRMCNEVGSHLPRWLSDISDFVGMDLYNPELLTYIRKLNSAYKTLMREDIGNTFAAQRLYDLNYLN